MKIIGVIMTYNCESLVQKAIDQIPKEEFDKLICTDDGSTDNTIEIVKKNNIEFIKNNHLGYGMNLYAGMKKAFELGATHVIELHGDSQYDFTYVKEMKQNFSQGCDLVLGNRFFSRFVNFIFGSEVIISLIIKLSPGPPANINS